MPLYGTCENIHPIYNSIFLKKNFIKLQFMLLPQRIAIKQGGPDIFQGNAGNLNRHYPG